MSNLGIWGADEARAWDLFVPRSQTQREVAFLEWAFERFSNRRVYDVLDLGCGTGRLAIGLASEGYAVTGIDRSSSMLKRAKQNADAKGVRLRLFRTPLNELEVDGRYDAAYSVFSVFNYLLDEEALSKALARIRSLLRPGGVLIIDTMNYASLFGVWKREISTTRKGKGWSVHRLVSHRVDDVNMLWYHAERTRMELGGGRREWNETHVFRMWTFPELRGQFQANGFPRVRLFGELRAGAKEAKTHARRLVVVAARRPPFRREP